MIELYRRRNRSQCIITIRRAKDVFDTSNDMPFGNGVLVIADLAGAERDKKTGNMGSRLGESHFINNTSMVFGLCLRSLLEHQRNPKRPLEMHYKNSLLTRYLKEYLEGKKRMTLILFLFFILSCVISLRFGALIDEVVNDLNLILY
ncbi:Kinesin-like protein KIF22 [Carex littledalei]|uniref:Kinesin-like protein KIF22 n=1 Tax=Carex littledalei TaxID=544730 RepID=A0A833QIT4_9POAL|nr:Kinesin-like protein KIF22 [Carex littledalei]